MEDRSQEALKRYRLKIYNIYKARGAFLLETDCGLKLYKSFEGSKNRALFEDKVKQHLFLNGYPNTDLFVRTITKCDQRGWVTGRASGAEYIFGLDGYI